MIFGVPALQPVTQVLSCTQSAVHFSQFDQVGLSDVAETRSTVIGQNDGGLCRLNIPPGWVIANGLSGGLVQLGKVGKSFCMFKLKYFTLVIVSHPLSLSWIPAILGLHL